MDGPDLRRLGFRPLQRPQRDVELSIQCRAYGRHRSKREVLVAAEDLAYASAAYSEEFPKSCGFNLQRIQTLSNRIGDDRR